MTIAMNELSMLAHALVHAERDVEQQEQRLKESKEHARVLREETLPAAMQEIGLSKVVLDSGETIDVKQDVYLSVPADRREEAYGWLDEHGFGGMIKTEVKALFGKGEAEEAAALAERMQEQGLDVLLKRDVHAQTLKAWAREQLAAGAELPMDLFGARPVWTAKVKSA